ncbi:FAD-dependent thiol oxidase [Auriculariales sp. MPI-PUGE-AT-0066]|nr:FAD-dependent thiol oxidase [Auriculariales sp. MPI-PUGE-AT-0066]
MSSESKPPPLASSSAPQPKLPPGMMIGPDGKPCKICDGFQSFTKNAAKAGAGAAVAAAFSAKSASECPPDRDALGRATWTFLHTSAAYYPIQPSPAQRSHMLSLMRALPALYPCGHCAEHFGEQLRVTPPDAAVANRTTLSRWLCERHNEINDMLGKSAFDCSKTEERWRTGPSDGSCD